MIILLNLSLKRETPVPDTWSMLYLDSTESARKEKGVSSDEESQHLQYLHTRPALYNT